MITKIACLKYSDSSNLGDEIQSIAAINLLKKLGYDFGGFIDRNNTEFQEIPLLVSGFIFANRLDYLLNSKVQPIFTNMHLAAVYMNNKIQASEKLYKHYNNVNPLAVEIEQQPHSWSTMTSMHSLIIVLPLLLIEETMNPRMAKYLL